MSKWFESSFERGFFLGMWTGTGITLVLVFIFLG